MGCQSSSSLRVAPLQSSKDPQRGQSSIRAQWNENLEKNPSKDSKVGSLVVNYIIDKYEPIYQKLTPTTVFLDPDFPTNFKSIADNSELAGAPNEKVIAWKRPIEFLGVEKSKINVFLDKIEPNDVHQGQLSNCYFLSALQSLSEDNYLIKRLFERSTYCDSGIYSVFINHDGIWTQVIVDDQFPVNTELKRPQFSTGTGPELWTLLLEKAYSKNFKSYMRIAYGYPQEAIADLTGAPYSAILIGKGLEDDVWKFLKSNCSKNYLLTAITSPDPDKPGANLITMKGIITNHAYSILDVKEINVKSGIERIVQIRNPWGFTEWNGDWSDNSDKWNDDTKKQVNYVKRDDGTFWMNINDLCIAYIYIAVNFVRPEYYFTSLSLPAKDSIGIQVFTFTVPKSSTPNGKVNTYIQFHQKDRRQFDKADQYKYSPAEIRLFEGTSTSQFNVQVGISKFWQRNGYLEADLECGKTYFGIVYVAWYTPKQYDSVVSVYSAAPIKVYRVDLSNEYEKQVVTVNALSLGVVSDTATQCPEHPEITVAYDYGFGWFYRLYENKSKDTIAKDLLVFSDVTDLEVQGSTQVVGGNKFYVQIGPQSKKLLTFKTKQEYKMINYFIGIESNDVMASKVLQKPEYSTVIGSGTNTVTFSYASVNAGVAFVYQNLTNLEFIGKTKFILTNLSFLDSNADVTKPFDIRVAPKQTFLIYFTQIELDKAYNYEAQHLS